MTRGGRFASRRALVTGASRGIGAALARRLAAEGADVAIVARTLHANDHPPGSLEETARAAEAHGARVAIITADMASADHRGTVVPRAVEGLGGPIDILVNNAAAAMYQPLSDYPLKRRRMTFEVNVHGPLDLAQAVLPAMIERGEGWIVNVSSGTARPLSGPPFATGVLGATTGIYGASKAALNRLTNALAMELYGTGVRVNTIEPRAAVMSPGAEAVVGGMLREDQIESMDEMVEGILAVCDCPADFTGRICVSLDLIAELGLNRAGLVAR